MKQNSLKEEGKLYQVVEINLDGAYLQNLEDNKVYKEIDISKETLQKIGNDTILRYKNGEYIIEKELTEKFFEGLIDITEYQNKEKHMNLKEQIEKYKPYNEQEENDKELMLKYIDTFSDVLTRENKMCHFTASNWIVNKERTKVLMIYHNIYKSWAWTGGHCDGDSNLLHVALKEAEEETGLKNLKLLSNGIYGLQILTVDSHIKRGNFVPSHLHLDCCFLLEADESEVLKIKEDENSGVKWVDIDKAVELTNEEKMKPIYKKLNEKMK